MRRWWIISSLFGGMPAETYHHLDGDRLACGRTLPAACVRLVSGFDSRADQRRKRCPSCVRALAAT